MTVVIYLVLIVFLLLLNAFFVLAEFAVVKARPTQMEALAAAGDRRARRVHYVQQHLVPFLSVCQVGITLASIGLGFAGEPALAGFVMPLVRAVVGETAAAATAHGIAITVAYLLVSALHIVIGEQVPKFLAIGNPQKSALFIAYPMVFFHYLFIVPSTALNWGVNAMLRLLRMPPAASDPAHTEDEIRIILDRSQSHGMMSFRRLLYIENVLDMGALTVRNAMRPREGVVCLRVGASGDEIKRTVAKFRHARYPLIGQDPDRPIGYVHVKDLYLTGSAGNETRDLASLARPCMTTREQHPLEQLLPEMQKKGARMALVEDEKGRWTGIITLEDAIEEVIGRIEEEFPTEPPVRLSDLLSAERVVLDVEGGSILAAARNALARLRPGELPLDLDEIVVHLAERERVVSSYVGRQLAIPHARLAELTEPFVAVARLRKAIPAPTAGETIGLLFILLTPAGAPRSHQTLLSNIAGIFSSEFLEERLMSAPTAAEVYSVISTAEQSVVSA